MSFSGNTMFTILFENSMVGNRDVYDSRFEVLFALELIVNFCLYISAEQDSILENLVRPLVMSL